MFFLKLHKISTVVAVISLFLATVLFFLSTFDQTLSLNVLPQSMEKVVRLVAWAAGTVAFGSSLISAVLSLYCISEKH